MNKKGQVGVVGAIFIFLVFLLNWFIWLGGFLADVGTNVVVSNSLTGIEAFFFSNLNLVVLLGMILGMMGWMYLSAY